MFAPLPVAILLLIIGAFGLVVGAKLCVGQAFKLAGRMNASHWNVGVLVVGFATSFPEMIVSAVAAIKGQPDVGIGNAIGSNIANIGLVLGLVALITPQQVTRQLLTREMPLLFGVMVFSGLLLLNLDFQRWEAVMLLGAMVILLVIMARWLGNETELAGPPPPAGSSSQSVLMMVLGLFVSIVVLYISSEALIRGATTIARLLGVSDLVIGITVVALGTSLPELAASLVAAYRQSSAIAVGNIVGSNLFNLLAVLAMPGLFHPGPINSAVISRDYPFMGALTLMFYAFIMNQSLARWQGAILLMSLAGYDFSLYYWPIQ